MKKVSKIIMILVVIITFIMIPQQAFAKSKNPNKPDIQTNQMHKPTTKVSENIADWNFSMDQGVPTKLTDKVGWVLGLLRNLAIILTALVITILGIKYMIGSVEQKADYKKAYVNIIIGAVLITMITSIVDMIFSAAQNLA